MDSKLVESDRLGVRDFEQLGVESERLGVVRITECLPACPLEVEANLSGVL